MNDCSKKLMRRLLLSFLVVSFLFSCRLSKKEKALKTVAIELQEKGFVGQPNRRKDYVLWAKKLGNKNTIGNDLTVVKIYSEKEDKVIFEQTLRAGKATWLNNDSIEIRFVVEANLHGKERLLGYYYSVRTRKLVPIKKADQLIRR